ncbi:MAG: aspartate/glutamate racemase family protein [Chthoniobacteraceae bacterium]
MRISRDILVAGLWLMVPVVLAETPASPEARLAPLLEHVRSNRDGRAPWSLDFPALEGDRTGLPIGVFDSGIGGLTVLEAILSLDSFNNKTLQPGADGVPDFAGERFIYLGDQANMPYGNYAKNGKEIFLRELIVKDAVFLLGRRYHSGGAVRFDKPPVKAIVIACNTATAFGIGDIRGALASWKLDVPVIGVVEAGARAVSERLPSGQRGGAIAVLATVGTCDSGAYPRAIGRAGGLAGKSLPPVAQQGSVGLAGALEGNPAFITTGSQTTAYLGPAVGNAGSPIDPSLLPVYGFDMAGVLGEAKDPGSWRLNSVANYVRYDVATLVTNYMKRGGGPPISTVVLGCTHFPIARKEIAGAFSRLRDYRDATGLQPYRNAIDEHLEFVDPAEFTAKELFRELARGRLRSSRDGTQPPRIEASFLSVPNPLCREARLTGDGGLDAAYKYGREPGRLETEDVLCVPMKEAGSVLDSLSGIAHALPKVFTELRAH